MLDNLKIERIVISELIPYAGNAKQHPPEQIAQIVASINEFGFNDPIAIDENNVIIEGHGRLLAAQKLMMVDVPVIRLAHLSEAQKKAYILAHNKLTLNTGFDTELLKVELASLRDFDFNLSLTGFELTEVDDYLKGLEPVGTEPEGDPDEVPGPPVEPVTRVGDLYEIGPHRLLCGDSASMSDVQKLMNGHKSDMVFMDPPYGVDYQGGYSPTSRNRSVQGDKNTDLYLTVMPALVAASEDVAAFYICYSPNLPSVVLDISKYLRIRSIIAWVKNLANYGCLAAQYKPKFECIIYAHKHGFSPFWQGPTNEVNVWEVDKNRKNEYHPTEKPVALIGRAIENSCPKNGLILDLFGGSGTTMVAAQQADRRACLMEIDPHYCDVIVTRMRELFPGLEVRRNGELI